MSLCASRPGALSTLIWLQVALLGGAMGSFAALAAHRLPALASLWRPRSACPACRRQLAWYELVPVVSWCLLAGRCRSCRAWIGARALAAEVVMAGLALALAAEMGVGLRWAVWLVAITLLYAAALVDIDCWWVPDPLVAALAVWLFLAGLAGAGGGDIGEVWAALAGTLPAWALWSVGAGWSRLRRREALGLGDVKLVAAVGLGLGPLRAWVMLVLAACQGALVGLALRLAGGHPERPTGILPAALVDDADWRPPPGAFPFAPFVLLATLEVLLGWRLVGRGVSRWLGAGP